MTSLSNYIFYIDTVVNNCVQYDNNFLLTQYDRSTGNAINYCYDCTNCCLQCSTNYHLKNGQCFTCPQLFTNCISCTNLTCTQCVDSTYFIDGTTCSLCTTKYTSACLYCTQTDCTQCVNSLYYLSNGQCSLCNLHYPNCLKCDN